MDFVSSFFSHSYSILAIILVLGGLIFLHELGHFLAFRSLGVGIVTFSIGMGPKIWGIKKGKTTYQIAAFPFGGYVAAVGEYSKDVEEIGFTQEEAVSNRPAWQRMYFAFAGPFANLLTAWAIYTLLSLTSGVNILLPQVGALLPDSPAVLAGLQEKDLITAIDGKAIDAWNEVPEIVNNSNGKAMVFTVERDNTFFDLTIEPKRMPRTNIFGEEEIAWLIGIQPLGTIRNEELSFSASLKQGVTQSWDMIALTLTGLKKMATGSVSADSVGGPLLIGEMIAKQAENGLVSLLLLTALISVNLGLLNLLPIPVLDGGLIFFCLIETVIRRPVPEKLQERLMQLGAVLLIGLMIFATFNDIMRWFK